MNPFDTLRSIAKRTRDAAIEDAREQYNKTIQDIAGLQQRLLPPKPVERPANRLTKTLIDLMVDCLPDGPFTIDDLYGRVLEADHDRKPTKATIRTNVHRLIDQGVVERTQKADGTRRAMFAAMSR